MYNIRINIFIYLLLLVSFPLFGQIKIHKHITQEDGLVQGQVASMLQDSKGYIWFATYDGVSKWDGKYFENIQTHNGLLSSVVLDIKEGIDGKIYIACYQGGILIYDNGQLDTLNKKNGLLSNAITSIIVLPNNEILFAGTGNKITKLKNGNLSDWAKEVNYPNNNKYTIRDSYQDKQGVLYLATQKGLLIYKNNTFQIITSKDGLNHNLLFSVVGNNKGVLYTASYKGINKIENGIISELTKLPGFRNSYSSKVIVSSDGTLFGATTNGIITEKDGIIKTLTEKNGLSFNQCYSVLEDNNGIIYFGTQGFGVSLYNPKEIFVNYNKNTGLPNKSIWSILKTDDGNLYLGSTKGVIIKTKTNISILNKKNGLIDNFVRVLKQSKDGRILVGTNGGLSIVDKGNFKNFPLRNKFGVTQIYSILETDSGDIYLGTQTGLVILRNNIIIKKDESEFIRKKMLENLGGESIYSIAKLNEHSFVFGTIQGLVIYSKGSLKFFTTKNGLVDNSANVVHVTNNGTILVGTLKGINIIKNGIVTDTIDVSDGLSNNSIADIEEDTKGRIFVSTYNGLNVLTNINNRLTIRQLYKKDGLIGNDFTQNGTYVDNEGNLWLATLLGISKYNPNSDAPPKVLPKIYLTGVEIFNKNYPLSKLLKLKKLEYNQNYIKFIYTGINLSAPEKIIYKYRLNGIDKGWVKSKNNFANYTNLEKGNYTFEVKARNEWGYWSKPAKISFVINPAWWETWWFRLLIISSISFLIWSLFQYRLNYLLKIERLRTKIASDLHDDVGSLLTQISINADSLNYTSDTNKIKEKSGFIVSKSGEVINLMRDVIWSIDSRNDTFESLVDRIHNFALEFLPQKGIILEFENKITELKKNLKINFRQNTMMIAKEAINNSVKYSECNKIKILLEYKSKTFKMIISDNGKGIDLENVKLGNGLKNMQMRANTIGAEIKFKNENGMIVYLTKRNI